MSIRSKILRAVSSVVIVGGIVVGVTLGVGAVAKAPEKEKEYPQLFERTIKTMQEGTVKLEKELFPVICAQIEQEKEAVFQEAVSATLPGAEGETPNLEQEYIDLDNKKHAWIMDELITRAKLEKMAFQIDTYFAHRGSPMQGTGAIFARESRITGIPGALGAGIAEAESSSGKLCYNGQSTYNYWGGKGYPGGFSSWDESTVTLYEGFLMVHHARNGPPQTMYDCPGYCEGNGTMANVDRIQKYIESIPYDIPGFENL